MIVWFPASVMDARSIEEHHRFTIQNVVALLTGHTVVYIHTPSWAINGLPVPHVHMVSDRAPVGVYGEAPPLRADAASARNARVGCLHDVAMELSGTDPDRLLMTPATFWTATGVDLPFREIHESFASMSLNFSWREWSVI